MGTAKRDWVDFGRDQKNVPQHGTGVAGANKPQHEGHRARRARVWPVSSAQIHPCALEAGAAVWGNAVFWAGKSLGVQVDPVKSQCGRVTACVSLFICKLNRQPTTS